MIGVIRTDKTKPTALLLEKKLKELAPKANGMVNWTGAPKPNGILNSASFTHKLQQLQKLKEKGVPCLDFMQPLAEWPKLPPKPGWLGRTNFHREGRDFRKKITPDFWVKPEDFTEEWRVHVFLTKKGNMRVLRCAKKIPASPNPHPWIRNHDYGWKFSYIEGCPDTMKELARTAVRALDLDFGAVDLGRNEDLIDLVIEVNTCPGLEEGNTLTKYAQNIVERLS